MKRVFLLVSVVGLVSVVVYSNPAVANRIGTYDGYDCVLAMDASGAISGTRRYQWGYLENYDGDDDMWVKCPIPGGGQSIDDVVIRVADQHTSDYVECELNCEDATSSSTYASGADTSAPAGGHGEDTLTVSGSGSYTDGECFLTCRIPDSGAYGRSAVHAYSVTTL